MIRLLPFILVALLVLGILGYFRFFAAKQSLVTSQTNTSQNPPAGGQASPIEVPKTLPGATLEDRVKILEDSIKAVVNKINNQSTPDSGLDSRLKIVEASITELKARVSSLENGSTGQTTTSTSTSSKSTIYIPLGSGGQTSSQSYASLSTFQITLDPSQYPGYKSMQLEVNMRLNQPGSTLYARLLNNNSGSATSSEISTTSTSSVVVSSSDFNLSSGSNTYILQTKTLDGSQGFLDYARIKVNF